MTIPSKGLVKLLPVSLRIATDVPAGTAYFQSGNLVMRTGLQDLIRDEIKYVIDETWALWERVPLSGPHPLETEVLSVIESRIKAVTTPDQLRLSSPPGETPTPMRVRYFWHRGRRYRVHTYALEIKRRGEADYVPWTRVHTPVTGVDVTITFTAELSWAINV